MRLKISLSHEAHEFPSSGFLVNMASSLFGLWLGDNNPSASISKFLSAFKSYCSFLSLGFNFINSSNFL